MISIRNAKLKDLRRSSEIYVDSWRNTYRGMIADEYLDGMTYEHASDHLRNYITEPSMRLFAAVDEKDSPVGILACSLYTEIPDCGILDVLHISGPYKGMGIGTDLVKCCASYMLDHGCTKMGVDVVTQNIKAIKFYRHTGAENYERYMDIFDGIGIDSLIMMWYDLEGVAAIKTKNNYEVMLEEAAV
ncbi:MAG: GNAT family N-acetyltransferase [Eubacteriaceae bacterium]|jgi:GNAT superfamily N-acetyltransferase|nr:GNAT family N-acetyltransferase [Eubacteriaceae bacterium]